VPLVDLMLQDLAATISDEDRGSSGSAQENCVAFALLKGTGGTDQVQGAEHDAGSDGAGSLSTPPPSSSHFLKPADFPSETTMAPSVKAQGADNDRLDDNADTDDDGCESDNEGFRSIDEGFTRGVSDDSMSTQPRGYCWGWGITDASTAAPTGHDFHEEQPQTRDGGPRGPERGPPSAGMVSTWPLVIVSKERFFAMREQSARNAARVLVELSAEIEQVAKHAEAQAPSETQSEEKYEGHPSADEVCSAWEQNDIIRVLRTQVATQRHELFALRTALAQWEAKSSWQEAIAAPSIAWPHGYLEGMGA